MEPMAEQPVSGIAYCLVSRGIDIDRRGKAGKGNGVPTDGFSEEVCLCYSVIRRPSIVHGDRAMEERPCIHRRPGKIMSDRIQQCLVPLPGNGMLGASVGRKTENEHKPI